MKTLIEKPWNAFGIMIASLVFCVPLAAVVAPEHGKQAAGSSESINKTEVKLQEILAEMNSEQARHQKKIESIQQELEKTESVLKPEEKKEKRWVSPRVALALGEDAR